MQVEKESNKNKESKVEEKMANGITIGTNYRVYAVQKVQTVAGEIVQLVHLKVLKYKPHDKFKPEPLFQGWRLLCLPWLLGPWLT